MQRLDYDELGGRQNRGRPRATSADIVYRSHSIQTHLERKVRRCDLLYVLCMLAIPFTCLSSVGVYRCSWTIKASTLDFQGVV